MDFTGRITIFSIPPVQLCSETYGCGTALDQLNGRLHSHISVSLACIFGSTFPAQHAPIEQFLSYNHHVSCFCLITVLSCASMPSLLLPAPLCHYGYTVLSLCLIKILADTSLSDLAVFSHFLSADLFSCCALFPVSF